MLSCRRRGSCAIRPQTAAISIVKRKFLLASGMEQAEYPAVCEKKQRASDVGTRVRTELRADQSGPQQIKLPSLSAVSTSPIVLSVPRLSSCARLLTACVLAYSSSSKPSSDFVQLASQSLG